MATLNSKLWLIRKAEGQEIRTITTDINYHYYLLIKMRRMNV
jgi:hypothetical protein